MKFGRYSPRFFELAQLYNQFSGRRFDAIRELAMRQRFIDVPLVFISQLSRSGGTLLCQLFDGHDNCLTFPPELKFGSRKKLIADLDGFIGKSHDAAANELLRYNTNGIRKGIRGSYKKGLGNNDPFIIDIFAFKYLFKSLWLNKHPQNGRDVLNIWFTSFFFSWLNFQWPGNIQYCISFASWTMVNEENVNKFFRYYPDGYLIHVIRDPVSWYQSVRAKRSPQTYRVFEIYRGLDDAINEYKNQAAIFEHNLNKYPGRVILLTYESLLSGRERVMKEICKIIGIKFNESLLQPTLNKMPGGENTSYRNVRVRYRALNVNEKRKMHDYCTPAYENLAAVCI